MTGNDDLAAAAAAIADLRRSIAAMRDRLGETVDVRRLRDDVARLASDLALIGGDQPPAGHTRTGGTVYIPEEDYDPSFWADAEDEGLGARRNA